MARYPSRPLLLAMAALLLLTTLPVKAAESCPPLLDFNFKRLQDETSQDLCQYTGKVVLVVNTASYCGYTGQYEGLEKLHAKYKDRGLVVLGFPSNDFHQEPAKNAEIANFCYNTYGVKFPMLSKSSVIGKDANPMYALLTKTSGKKPTWNFFKYLIDRNGDLVSSFSSHTPPEDVTLINAIEKALISGKGVQAQGNN
ncbi:MAG: glutathione peroxidase [Nitrosomonadaceae bacterium]